MTQLVRMKILQGYQGLDAMKKVKEGRKPSEPAQPQTSTALTSRSPSHRLAPRLLLLLFAGLDSTPPAGDHPCSPDHSGLIQGTVILLSSFHERPPCPLDGHNGLITLGCSGFSGRNVGRARGGMITCCVCLRICISRFPRRGSRIMSSDRLTGHCTNTPLALKIRGKHPVCTDNLYHDSHNVTGLYVLVCLRQSLHFWQSRRLNIRDEYIARLWPQGAR